MREKFENLISDFSDKEIIMKDAANKYARLNYKTIKVKGKDKAGSEKT